jgi:hypothetical protein
MLAPMPAHAKSGALALFSGQAGSHTHKPDSHFGRPTLPEPESDFAPHIPINIFMKSMH